MFINVISGQPKGAGGLPPVGGTHPMIPLTHISFTQESPGRRWSFAGLLLISLSLVGVWHTVHRINVSPFP